MAAILLHSLDDFNLYIPANAMLLAWMAGIAASLPTVTPIPTFVLEANTALERSPVEVTILEP